MCVSVCVCMCVCVCARACKYIYINKLLAVLSNRGVSGRALE